jgi:hypothetical protein
MAPVGAQKAWRVNVQINFAAPQGLCSDSMPQQTGGGRRGTQRQKRYIERARERVVPPEDRVSELRSR